VIAFPQFSNLRLARRVSDTGGPSAHA
jgi:hypothetical protein